MNETEKINYLEKAKSCSDMERDTSVIDSPHYEGCGAHCPHYEFLTDVEEYEPGKGRVTEITHICTHPELNGECPEDCTGCPLYNK